MSTRVPVSRVASKPAPEVSSASSGLSADTKKALLIGGAVAFAGLVAWFLLSKSSPAETEETAEPEPEVEKPKLRAAATPVLPVTAGAGAGGEESSEDEEDDGAAVKHVTKAELLKLLDEMYTKVSELQANLKGMHESGELTPEEVMEAHGDGIASLEKSLHNKYKVTQKDLSAAYERYEDDEDINAALQKLQSLFTLGDGDVQAPEGLTADEFLEKFNTQNSMMRDAISAIVEEVKASGKHGVDAMGMFQQLIMSRLGELEKTSQEKIGLTQQEFMGAFMKFGNDPRVTEAAMAVQTFTQQKQMELMSL